MKKIYLLVGSLAFLSYISKAQTEDTTEFKVKKTTVDLVYNHYIQDGVHSAVTGGTGTEELTVYSPNLGLKHTSGKNAYSFYGGSDIITSASTDNIDNVVSSASYVDARSHADISYARSFNEARSSAYVGTGFSIESDYFSTPVRFGLQHTSTSGRQTYSFDAQMYFDDLRWGRINPEHYAPVKLIYPEELRYKEWYDTYKRNSYNAKLGYSHILNKRNILGLYYGFAYQHGLLATPYNRIYFNDGTEAVEQLPEERIKGSLSLKVNSFIGGRTILKNNVTAYLDDFGIASFSFENETAFKVTPFFTLKPNFRFHIQSASKYFAPYKEHRADEEYYTSDYDLSAFTSYRLGLSSRFLMKNEIVSSFMFNSIEVGYSYYKRSDGLHAHLINLSLSFQHEKKKPLK